MSDKKHAPQPLEVVMLVDDDPYMLELLEEMLQQLGVHQVLKQPDARAALQNLGHVQPGLLICDLRMPDMDGIEFLDKVARLGYAGSVILHSGVDIGVIRAAERLAKAHGLRVLGAFEKPIDKFTLMRSIASFSALPEE